MPDSPHTRHDRRIAYRAMHWAAELLLAAGASVVLDAQYGHAEDRDEVAQVVAKTGASFALIECKVAPEIAAQRFLLRPAEHPGLDLTEARVIEMARDFPYTGKGLVVDTGNQPLDECDQAIRVYLGLQQEKR